MAIISFVEKCLLRVEGCLVVRSSSDDNFFQLLLIVQEFGCSHAAHMCNFQFLSVIQEVLRRKISSKGYQNILGVMSLFHNENLLLREGCSCFASFFQFKTYSGHKSICIKKSSKCKMSLRQKFFRCYVLLVVLDNSRVLKFSYDPDLLPIIQKVFII